MVERVVYLLGAGASYDAGGPLIKDFFSRDSQRANATHMEYYDGDQRFSTLETIYTDWAQGTENADIESFFKKVEFHSLIKKDFIDSSTGNRIKPDILRRYLVWYIVSFVRNSIARKRRIPEYYYEFAQSLKKWGKRYSIITFNYDLVFEKTIIEELGGVDYKIGKIRGLQEFSDSSSIPFLKLHGSLNWLLCPKCGRMEIFEFPVAHKYNRKGCVKSCRGYKEPLIVPPNPSKSEYLALVYELWNKADKMLSSADKIVIIGYSLPEIDTSARELLIEPVQNVDEFEIVTNSISSLRNIEEKLGRKSNTIIPTPFEDYVKAITK